MADEATQGATSGAMTGAATGAMVGSVVPGVGTLVGAGAGALIGGAAGFSSGKGASQSRKAAQRAAMERQRMAIGNYNNIRDLINPASVAALSNYDKALGVQERNIARQEQLVAQIDPTVIEASQQALKLLRGEQASTLAPLERQRQTQRQKLLDNLRRQLGSGAETSTAGIQALTRFDAETDSLFANAQQQAIQGLGQTFGQFSAYRPNMGNEATTFGNLAAGRFQVTQNQAQILQNAFNPVIGNAGASQVGAMMQGQYQQAMGSQMLQAGTQLGSSYLMRSGGTGGTNGVTPHPANARLSDLTGTVSNEPIQLDASNFGNYMYG